jgi:hypothetical protein
LSSAIVLVPQDLVQALSGLVQRGLDGPLGAPHRLGAGGDVEPDEVVQVDRQPLARRQLLDRALEVRCRAVRPAGRRA